MPTEWIIEQVPSSDKKKIEQLEKKGFEVYATNRKGTFLRKRKTAEAQADA